MENRIFEFFSQMGWDVYSGGLAGKIVIEDDFVEIPEDCSFEKFQEALRKISRNSDSVLRTEELARYVLGR